MKNFFFKSNDDLDIENNCENLINHTNDYLDNENYKEWLKILNENLNLPIKEIDFFVKKNIFNSYDFKNKNFRKKISFIFIPIYFLINIFYFFVIKIFKRRKNYKVQNFHLLIDDIKSQRELERYKKLADFFNYNSVAIRKSINDQIELKNCFVFFQKRFFNYDLDRKIFTFFLKMIKKNFILSLKLRINFYYIFLNLLDNYLFYNTIFSKFNFKYLITHTHYNTNNIKNYLLKKKCNGCSTVIQKNINSKNQTSFFYHSDVIFTYSDFIRIRENKSSYIDNQISIGSFFMEYYFYTKPSYTKEGYDILCLGGNEQYPNSANDRTKYHRQDYIEHLRWLIKISKDFPNLSIGFMHHANNKNNFEQNFLKKTNIKIIDKNKNSYEISNNSKLICSWASSMIIELLSLEKNCFYLDPGHRNTQFLGDIDISYDLRISSYENFKNKIDNFLVSRSIFSHDNKKFKKFCLESNDCSEKIYKFMK